MQYPTQKSKMTHADIMRTIYAIVVVFITDKFMVL
jgi:hypothetical protein